MLTLSTTTATPSTSKTWSSSLALVEGERVLEAGAAAAADGDAQRLALGVVLAAEQLADLLGRLVGEGDRLLWGLGHFTKCSEQVCENRRALSSERPNRRRLRHHGLPSRPSSSPSAGSRRISLYVSIDGDQERGDRDRRLRRLLRAPARLRERRDHLAALDRRLRLRLRAAARRRPRDRLDPHLGRHLRHLRGGQPGPRAAHRRRQGRRADPASSTRARRPAGWASACSAAAAAAAAGGDAEAALARAEQAREELKMWFAIDTLEYLRRGGRIGGARAWIGSALKIKPILTLEEEITPVERVRTRARSIERLRDYARQRHESGFDAWVVQHIQDDETAAAPGRRRPRDLRLRAGLRLRDRRRARRPRRPRPARHRQRLEVRS